MMLGGFAALIVVALVLSRCLNRDDDTVSAEWRTENVRRERVEYHGSGASWPWPLNKRELENGWLNRYREEQRRDVEQERKRA